MRWIFRLASGSLRWLRLGDLDGKDVAGAEDIRGEEHQLVIRAEAYIRFQRVILLRQIYQMSCLEKARLNQICLLGFNSPILRKGGLSRAV